MTSSTHPRSSDAEADRGKIPTSLLIYIQEALIHILLGVGVGVNQCYDILNYNFSWSGQHYGTSKNRPELCLRWKRLCSISMGQCLLSCPKCWICYWGSTSGEHNIPLLVLWKLWTNCIMTVVKLQVIDWEIIIMYASHNNMWSKFKVIWNEKEA